MKTLVMMGIGVTMWMLLTVQAVANPPLELVSLELPPFVYEEHEEIKGICVDLMTEVFARMAQPISIRLYPWARAWAMIQSGDAAAIFPIGKNPERELTADYPSEVLFEMPISLFVQKDSSITFDGNLTALAPYRFGVLRGAKYGEKFDEARESGILTKVEDVADYRQNILKLVNNRLDIVVGPRHNVLYVAKELGQQDAMKELMPVLNTWLVYLSFSKHSVLPPDLKDQFVHTLQDMKRDGTYEKIVKAYIPQCAPETVAGMGEKKKRGQKRGQICP